MKTVQILRYVVVVEAVKPPALYTPSVALSLGCALYHGPVDINERVHLAPLQTTNGELDVLLCVRAEASVPHVCTEECTPINMTEMVEGVLINKVDPTVAQAEGCTVLINAGDCCQQRGVRSGVRGRLSGGPASRQA